MASQFVRNASDRGFKHGHTRYKKMTRVYRAWADMVKRCTNPQCIVYRHYGGRGIKVCASWLTFENFLADMGQPPTDKHELDRYPNQDGDYKPGNCRWATRSENMRNTRRNHLLTFQGRTQCLTAWAEELGVPARRLKDRISKLGWSVERALTTPRNPNDHLITFNGKTQGIAAWAKELGIPLKRLCDRIVKLGWTTERALTS